MLCGEIDQDRTHNFYPDDSEITGCGEEGNHAIR